MAPRAFIIGHPVKHSRSPLIHGTWLKTYGLAGSYEAIDTFTPELPALFARLRAGEFKGGNVTIPLKLDVLRHCDTVDPLARQIGAVNTLLTLHGKVFGFNTDYMGFLANLDQGAPGWDKDLGEVIVLGAGGAARAVLVALAQRGARTIHILNRTPETAIETARSLAGPFIPHGLEAFAGLAPRASLVVNTTSVGMDNTRFEGLDLLLLPAHAVVTDIVYVPLVTPLLADAAARGLRTVDGLGMLLHQAVPGFKAWFGVEPEVTPQLRAVVEATL